MDIYERLGATKLINAQGTVTKIGGSLMDPDVMRVMREAAGSFVNITEFHHKAGERVADILGVPGACITCGAAAGIEKGALAVNPQCLSEDEIPLVVKRLKELGGSGG